MVTAIELTVAGEVEKGISERANGFIDESLEINCNGFLSEVVDRWLEDSMMNSEIFLGFLKYLDEPSTKTILVPSR